MLYLAIAPRALASRTRSIEPDVSSTTPHGAASGGLRITEFASYCSLRSAKSTDSAILANPEELLSAPFQAYPKPLRKFLESLKAAHGLTSLWSTSMRSLPQTLALAIACLGSLPVAAQEIHPKLELRTTTGQTVFHIGERIALTLTLTGCPFQSVRRKRDTCTSEHQRQLAQLHPVQA